MYVLYGALGVIALFLGVILVRTLTFKPKKSVDVDKTEVVFDKDKAISNLQTLVKFKTISYQDSSLEDDGEFQGLLISFRSFIPMFLQNVSI